MTREHIKVRAASGDREADHEVLETLADWLLKDRDVGGHVEIVKARRSAAGNMDAGLLDYIQLLSGAGFSIASLAYAHRAWRSTLPSQQRSTPIVIERGRARITIDDDSAETAARLIQALESQEEEPSTPPEDA
ncbi:hypothetical protein [Streptomyces sp. NBC_00878]|uniref:effector-associated constant component EACC1 n=1 Tax=Streptomyces sp. NBC_00878 TaxID=2975854 RepID=UPI00225A0BDA|nr:hypothetical protein [Streptomyces sp. NBC_00878]MCX4902978.1 hypothetical protein [Streptomyces sp. NBC_00878]